MLNEAFSIYRNNLAYTDTCIQQIENVQQAQLSQLVAEARRVWRSPGEPDQIAALYLTGDPLVVPHEVLPNEMALCSPRFADFCRQCAGETEHTDFGVFAALSDADGILEENEDADEPTAMSAFRTAYMQNRYTDQAWRSFAEHISGLTAEYFSSYAAVCEEVYNDRCHYCILPLYTTTDGHLISFRKLIDKYDLKICLETEVEMADESIMRFVLLRRKVVEEGQTHVPAKVALSVVLSEDRCIGALLTACETLGAVVTAVYSIPLEYGDRSQEYCLELDMTDGDLPALSLFLEASQLRYTLVGLYDAV